MYAVALSTDLSSLTLFGKKTDKQGMKNTGKLTKYGFLTISCFFVDEDHLKHGAGTCKIPEKHDKKQKITSHIKDRNCFKTNLKVGYLKLAFHFEE